MNEEKLKEFLKHLMVWTDVNSRPDVHKMLLKQLDESFPKHSQSCPKTKEEKKDE